MKKKIFSLAAVCVILAAVLTTTGCSSGGKSAGSDATLKSVKFGTETATLGTPKDTYSAAVAGTVVIVQASNNLVITPTDSSADVQIAIVKAGDTFDETDLEWPDSGQYVFATGDTLAIRVVAADNSATLFYKINVTLANVALQSLTVGGTTIVLPGAGSTWQTAPAGGFALFTYPVEDQPTGGLAVVATAKDAASTITYGHAEGNNEPSFTATSTITFKDGEYLYIKVTAEDGNSAVYKIVINFMQSGTIKYGSPKIGYGADGSDTGSAGKPTTAGTPGYIDPLWNDPTLEEYPIEKIYASDSGQLLDPNNGLLDENGKSKTIATAKALWDEEGLSIFLKVIDSDVSTVDNEHETDSFELFVNEDLTYSGTGSQKYANGGSQYRVAANGQRSGQGDSPAAMNALNKTSAWKTSDGYIIVMKAPWRLRNKFFSNTTYRNNWEFGFELQVNVAAESGNRYGVLVWNNVAHTNYMDAGDYGVAKLVGQTGELNYPPLAPVINSAGQPQGGSYSPGENVSLSVTATSLDSTSFTYQWYSAESATVAGTPITGATSATYSFEAPDETTFYYVVVSNTLNGKTATTTSNRARITISNIPMLHQLTLAEHYAVYKFELPANTTFADYKSITVDYFMDSDNFAVPVRSVRLHGNYNPTDFGSLNGYSHFSWGSGANAQYIYDDRTNLNDATPTAAANTWFTMTYRLNDINSSGAPNPNSGFEAKNKPAATDIGPFYFGIGIPGGSGGSPPPVQPKTQLVKNITMVHGTDTTKNVVTTSFFGFVGNTDNGLNGPVKLELVPDPSAVVPPDDPLVINNPTPVLVGTNGADGTVTIATNGKTVEVRNEQSSSNIGFYYELPETWNEYTTLKFYFTFANNTEGDIKLTPKKGKTFSNDIAPADYPSFSVGDQTYTITPIHSKLVPMTDDALAFQVNAWLSTAGANKQYYDVTCTKIELIEYVGPPAPPPETEEVTINVDVTGIYDTTIGTGLGTLLANVPSGGKAVFSFSSAAANTYAVIPLAAADIAKINTATSIKINVQGSTDESTETASWRYYLGTPTTNTSWNKINALPNNSTTGNPFSSIKGELSGTLTGNAFPPASGCFVLRLDTGGTTATVTIDSITIKVEVPK